eukprot:1157111-Pelagomonas_calceolata.AAC.12
MQLHHIHPQLAVSSLGLRAPCCTSGILRVSSRDEAIGLAHSACTAAPAGTARDVASWASETNKGVSAEMMRQTFETLHEMSHAFALGQNRTPERCSGLKQRCKAAEQAPHELINPPSQAL